MQPIGADRTLTLGLEAGPSVDGACEGGCEHTRYSECAAERVRAKRAARRAEPGIRRALFDGNDPTMGGE